MKKMLIADDNKQITTILSGYAKKEGFEPVVALDGAEALDKYLQYEHEIAVVLLDVMMPEIDGFEVCRRLRKESMVPIIMITARGEDYDKIMGLDKAVQRTGGDGPRACGTASSGGAGAGERSDSVLRKSVH